MVVVAEFKAAAVQIERLLIEMSLVLSGLHLRLLRWLTLGPLCQAIRSLQESGD
jgi:hypothetical protein